MIVIIPLIALGLAGAIIFFSYKNKKVIAEPNEKEEDKGIENKVEKLLRMRKYKVLKKKKHSYNLVYNNRMAEVRLDKVGMVKKNRKTYLLLVNNQEEKFTENKELRKNVLEYNYASDVKGVVVVNAHDKSIDTISFYNKREKELSRWVQGLLIIVTVLLTINIFFLINFMYKS